MASRRWCALLVGTVSLAACAAPSAGVGATVTSAVVTPERLFAFHSAFWLNLHHFLYALSRARTGRDAGRETVSAALSDTAGVGALPVAEREAWARSLAFYDSAIAPRDAVFDSSMIAWKASLAALADGASPRGRGLDPALAEALAGAAPAYRAIWWARHDAANSAWLARARPLVDAHGASIAEGVARAVRMPWPASPIRVDLSAYTNWAGAYTTERPSHIMMSSLARGYRDTLGLEMLFHEALHTMEDSLAAARATARQATGKRIPYDVVHALIFYTAGEVTRRAVPGHVPYIESQGLVSRGSMSRFFPILRRQWKPYLDGTRTFDEAFSAVVGEL